MEEPYLINLPTMSGKSGQLSFIDESEGLPITVKRAYWIYDSEEGAQRGNHAHLHSDRVMICVKGTVRVTLENTSGRKYNYKLEQPSVALYFPKLHWIHIEFSEGAILVVLSSCAFKEDVMVRDYDEFKMLSSK